jgi:hypothetical protein
VGAISGPVNVCPYTGSSNSIIANNNATYSVVANNATGYTWVVAGGSVVTGDGTNTVTVHFDDGQPLYRVTVTAIGCDSSKSVSLTLTRPTTPAVAITLPTGPTSVCSYIGDSVDVATYNVVRNAVYAYYTWTTPLNTQIVSANWDSSQIQVKYLSGFTATTATAITVRGVSACLTSAAQTLKILSTAAAPVVPGVEICSAGIATVVAKRVNSDETVRWYSTTSSTAILATGDTLTRLTNADSTYYALSVVNNACPSARVAVKVRVVTTKPVAPASSATAIVQTLVSQVCGNRVYRFTAAALPTAAPATGVAAATGYRWSLSGSTFTLGLNAFVDSGDVNIDTTQIRGRVIRIRFTSNNKAVTGDNIQLSYSSACSGNSDPLSVKLTNTQLVAPKAPIATAITITPVDVATCGTRLYRYSAAALPPTSTLTTGAKDTTWAAATGWSWSLLSNNNRFVIGQNMFVDSGSLSSQAILVRYTTDLGVSTVVGSVDSMKLAYTSSCGTGLYSGKPLSNAPLLAPLAPASITSASIRVADCGNRLYRYTAPVLPAAVTAGTVNRAAPTGYVWTFTGTLADDSVTILNSYQNGRIVDVLFTNNRGAVGTIAIGSVIGDSIRVAYTSSCGNSATKGLKLVNLQLKAPRKPSSITVTVLDPNTCGARRVKYEAPALPDSTTARTTAGITTVDTAKATGYFWDFVGNMGATIVSGTSTSQVIEVEFSNNLGSGAGDSVRLVYTSCIGNSPRLATRLALTSMLPTPASSGITIANVVTNVCGGRVYRYTAPAAAGSTSSTVASTGYEWSISGAFAGTFDNTTNGFILDTTLAQGATVTTTNGVLSIKGMSVIKLKFFKNTASGAGDSIRVRYTTESCGAGLFASKALGIIIIGQPAAPTVTATVIASTSTTCGGRKVRYSVPTMPTATATAAAATGYSWRFPGSTLHGGLGTTYEIDSMDAAGLSASRVIVVRYLDNSAANIASGTTDSTICAYTSACGTGLSKGVKVPLTTALTGCLQVTKAPSVPRPTESMNVKVFPNPSTTNFNVQVITAGTEEVSVRVLDLQGRFIKSVKVAPNRTMNIGSELKAGAYFIEVRQGREVKTTRVIKF